MLLLARQWDLQGEGEENAAGLLFSDRGGKKYLKCVEMQEAAFCYYLQKHLHQKGFAKGLRFIPNKYGDAYGIWENATVFLTDFFENAAFILNSEYDLWRLSSLLSEFHNAADDSTCHACL